MALVPAAFATTDMVGDTSNTYDTLSNTHLWMTKITALGSGPLQTIGINFQSNSAGGNIVLGIYSDNSGSPNSRLGQSSPTALAAGWNDLSITGVTITQGVSYWLAESPQNSNNPVYYKTGSTSLSNYQNYNYNGVLPDSSGDPNANDHTFNMRMTYGTGTTTTTTASSTTTTAATTTTATGPSTTTTAATTTLPPTGIWILPGQLATVKFLTTLSRGTHTFRLCTPSACQTGYLTIS